MNRSILMGIVSIFAVVSLVGGVTFALFSSQATNADNTFGAGTLVLSINTITGSSPGVFTVSGVDPGETVGPQTLTLKNEGSVNASSVIVSAITVNPTPAPPPNLGDKLTLNLYKDDGDNSFEPGGDDALVGSATLTNPVWTGHSLGFGLASGGSQVLFATMTFDSSSGNEYQSTGVSFDLAFQANQ